MAIPSDFLTLKTGHISESCSPLCAPEFRVLLPLSAFFLGLLPEMPTSYLLWVSQCRPFDFRIPLEGQKKRSSGLYLWRRGCWENGNETWWELGRGHPRAIAVSVAAETPGLAVNFSENLTCISVSMHVFSEQLIYFYTVYVCVFACMCVYASHACLLPEEARRECQIP